MATYTSNYGWTKPSGSDNVDISVLNDNLDDQDSTIHDAFLNMAPPFSESSTYAVDDIVLYGTGLYKCHTAVVTPGSWTGSTNWQVYKLSEGGSGGGGTTNYNALTNKPQINSVELSGNKTAAQLGLMANDGVVANPTGQTTGTLTALEVGGTKYAVGGGSGTSDYTDLTNKPSINSVELSGNKTTSDLGINADNVMMNDGASVEADLASAVPRTASGTTIAQLVSALNQLSEEQQTRCVINVSASFGDRVLRRIFGTTYSGIFMSTTDATKYCFQLTATISNPQYTYSELGSSTLTELTVTAWTLYYQGTPIS
jgi:hypothetical protein